MLEIMARLTAFYCWKQGPLDPDDCILKFRLYVTQVHAILQQRLAALPGPVFQPAALLFCARKVPCSPLIMFPTHSQCVNTGSTSSGQFFLRTPKSAHAM